MTKTVKVKVAVAVDENGVYVASGWLDADDQSLWDSVLDTVADGERRYYLTAELELPETKTIKADAQDA